MELEYWWTLDGLLDDYLEAEERDGGGEGWISSLAFSLLVADVPKGSSGQEESSKTDGNPMIGAVCSPVLRAQGDRARPVQWSRGIFIPLGPVGFIPLGALFCVACFHSLFRVVLWPLAFGLEGFGLLN